MENDKRLETLKRIAGLSESVRSLESWESVETRNILTGVKSTSEDLERLGFLESAVWQELREFVQQIEDGIASGELKPQDSIDLTGRIADIIDGYLSTCLMYETRDLYEEAKKQHDWEFAKSSASKIKTLRDIWPESVSWRDPKAFKLFERKSLQLRNELEAVDRDSMLKVFSPKDKSLYRWRISSRLPWTLKLRHIADYIFFWWIIAIGVPLGVFLLIGLASATVAFWSAVAFSSLCIVVTISSLLMIAVGRFFPETRSGERIQESLPKVSKMAKGERLSERKFAEARQHFAQGRQNFAKAMRKTSKMGIGLLASFSIGGLLYVMSFPIDSLRMGFVGGVDSFAQWILFYVNTLIQLITLNIPDLIGWNLSTIEAESGYSKLATIVLQLLITASVVHIAIHFWSSFFRKSVYYGTTDGLFWNQRFSPAKGSRVIVERVAKEVQYQAPDKVWLDDFIHVFEEHHKKLRE